MNGRPTEDGFTRSGRRPKDTGARPPPLPRVIPIDQAFHDQNLLGAALGQTKSWATWEVAMKAAFALQLDAAEMEIFAAISGGRPLPKKRVRELWCLCGRRGGKSRMAALMAVYIACFVKHRLAPGELGAVLLLASSADQSQVVLNYVKSFLTSSPVLRQEIESITKTEIVLRNQISIIARANSYRTVRGRTLVAAIFDEISFWRDEASATPDVETYSAILPSLATVNGMLISISSAYRRAGLMYSKHRDLFGVDNPDMLFLVGTTLQFNPMLDASVIEAQRVADPVAARSEWLSEFRADLATFLDEELIERAIDYGRPLELPPRDGIFYKAFTDASGGTGKDSYTLAIAHKDGERYIVDLVRGSPSGISFDPAELTLAYATLCKEYRIRSVIGDFYAAEWVRGAWSKNGVSYVPSDIAKSQIYLEVLPLFSRGLISMPEHPKLLRELRLLERRTHKSGKDSVDHGKSGHDDFANSMCGVLRTLSSYVGGSYDLATWQAAFGDTPEEPPRQLHPQYQQFAVPPPYSPWLSYDMISQHEQREVTAHPAPPPPTPEQIREVFAKLEAERGSPLK